MSHHSIRNRGYFDLFKLLIFSFCFFMLPSHAISLNLMQSFGEPDLFNPTFIATDTVGNIYTQVSQAEARGNYDYTYTYTLQTISKAGVHLAKFPSLGGRIALSKDNNYIYEASFDGNSTITLVKYNKIGTPLKTIKIKNLKNSLVADITTDSLDQIYINLNKQILVYNSQFKLIKIIKNYTEPNSNAVKSFNGISQLAINNKNQLLILDKNLPSSTEEFRFILIDLQGKLLKPVRSIKNFSGAPSLVSIAFDNSGYMYVAGIDTKDDAYQHVIGKFDSNGSLIQVINSYAKDLAIDKNNHLIMSTEQYTIKRLDDNGFISTVYGAEPKKLTNVQDFALDSNRNLYVLDAGHQRIQKFAPDGSLIAENWGNPALLGVFKRIRIAPNDQVYLEDAKEKIKIFNTEGVFLEAYERPWPSFDRKGNTYQIKSIKNEFSTDYSIEEIDSHDAIIKSMAYPKSDTFNINIFPCTSDLIIDTQDTIYTAACYQTIYYINHTFVSQMDVYLLKLDKNNGSIIKSKLITGSPGYGFTVNLNQDARNIIYLSSRSPYNRLTTFFLDENLVEIREIQNQLATPTQIDSNNSLYTLNSALNQIHKYAPVSLLKAPLPLSLKQVNAAGATLISWEDRTTDETGFNIYCCKNSTYINGKSEYQACVLKLVGTAAPNATRLRISRPTDITTGTSHYKYFITAVKGQEESLHSPFKEISIEIN